MFEMKSTHELVEIASAGGGFRIRATMKATHDLVQIASAASKTGAKITFVGLTMRSVHEIVQIASAGKGCIVFEDE